MTLSWRFTPVRTPAILSLLYLVMALPFASSAQEAAWPAKTHYRYEMVRGQRIFYREAGDASRPTILLLHGFPASSHAYRELIPLLSGHFHVIAPDDLGSGFSDRPDPDQVTYTFELLAGYLNDFIAAKGIDDYVLYMQDFGAPVGYRAMRLAPEKVRGLIVQNANAYLDGLTEVRRQFFRNAHDDRSPENVARLYAFVGREAIIRNQYLRDVSGKEDIMSPDAWTHDLSFLQAEKDRKIQVQLFQDYYNNLLAYPEWQAFLARRQPPTLIVWGRNDPAFIAAGAEAYLRDLPKAELHFLDAGHFAVEEKPVEIARHIVSFVRKLYGR